MRLTLRTLLAYLDDTLEPSEIKQIGQKVAESDAAQELIARLKQVTRRRRLTTPQDTGKGEPFDPNTVAAYLDNELPSEQVAELEKLCLESDVHLAEVAACHQILTLVLGEPALVPPTAKERMYGLVKGREAIPFRKAPDQAAVAGAADDTDDAFQSVLEFHRRQNGWRRWLVPVLGGILFLALPVVLIVAMMPGWNAAREPRTNPAVANADKATTDKDKSSKDTDPNKDKTSPKDASDPTKDKSNKDGTTTPGTDKDKPPKDSDNKDKPNADKPSDPDKGPGRPAEPSKERREAGRYQGPAKAGSPSILAQRAADGPATWKRVSPNTTVYTSDKLVSLPGYTSELTMNGGVRFQLWGTFPQFAAIPKPPPIYESAVTLHANPDFDLDLTLDRGRIFLINGKDKGPAKVRLRFEKEVWDITLAEHDTEVAIDLSKLTPANLDWTRDEPLATVGFCLVQGKAGLRVGYQEFPSLENPGPGLFRWTSHGPGLEGPGNAAGPHPIFSKEIPATKEANDIRAALLAVSERMGEKRPVNSALEEVVVDGPPFQRYVSIDCLGAIDAIPSLLDVVENKDEARGQDRLEAIFVLWRWIDHGSDYARQLYDRNTKSGFLIKKGFRSNEAAIVMEMLHYSDEYKARDPVTYDILADYLTHNKMLIRELAFLQLQLLTRGMKTIPQYNAAWDQDRRGRAAAEWKKMIENKELPPMATQPGPGGGPPGGSPK
jgi:hypothetical protein